jgi:hypothetical protein
VNTVVGLFITLAVLAGCSFPLWQVKQLTTGFPTKCCQHCHVTGDVASDAKPQKLRGREMMNLLD